MIQEEFIGRRVKVIDAANKYLEGIQGLIIDETKFLFHVETEDGIKKIPKKGAMLEIRNHKEKFIVKGDLLVTSPDERIKSKVE